ncbi:hypothetical protein ACIPEQ_03965 [Curtobacterium sp. NPDC087080]|uniref:hypothetical protein n=1 Tax=Curtobacterium sp. NPDC087080 TaxID=3363965 RepID=UPI0037F3B20E
MGVTLQTLNRYIREDGLKTHTKDGTVYVPAKTMRDIWRGKQVQRLATNTRRPVGVEATPTGEVSG